jgi:hypothetical protein
MIECSERVAGMSAMIHAYKISVRKPEEKRTFVDLVLGGRTINSV